MNKLWCKVIAGLLCAALVFVSLSMEFFHQHGDLSSRFDTAEAYHSSDDEAQIGTDFFFDCIACLYSSIYIADGFAGQFFDKYPQISVLANSNSEAFYSFITQYFSNRAPPFQLT